MKIGIFCSANQDINPAFFRATEALGHWTARNGHTIVFGGVGCGLMECVARAAKEAGGTTIGVVPAIVEENGRTSAYNDITLHCRDLSERKQLILDESDVFIALPGGIGTLDEVFTVAASYTIGYHCKHVILYNVSGYWDDAIAMLDGLERQGMVRGRWRDYIHVAASLDDVAYIVNTLPPNTNPGNE